MPCRVFVWRGLEVHCWVGVYVQSCCGTCYAQESARERVESVCCVLPAVFACQYIRCQAGMDEMQAVVKQVRCSGSAATCCSRDIKC